jgi:hypothetical protein
VQDKVVFRHHHSDFIAPVTNMPGQQQPVFNIFVSRVQRIGVTGGGKWGPGHIRIGKHRLDAGQTLCLGAVDFLHTTVGDGTAQIFGHQHPGYKKIVGKASPAGDLGHCVNPFNGFAYCH